VSYQSRLALLTKLSPRLMPGDCKQASKIGFSVVFLLNSSIKYSGIIRGVIEAFWVLRDAGRGWGYL